MDIPRVSKSVKRVTVLRKDSSGHVAPVTVYEKDSGKKKQSRWLKFPERVTRHIADAQARSAQRYLSRHRRSNTKKKDGWVRDYPVNVMRATRKGTKALKLNRLLSF
jgi:uncharacterized protein DUF6312